MMNTKSLEESTTASVVDSSQFGDDNQENEKQEIHPIGMAAIIKDENENYNLIIRNMKLNRDEYKTLEEAQNAYYNDMWVQDMKLAALTNIFMEKMDAIEEKLNTKN